MNTRKCDMCKKEMTNLDRTYQVTIGEASFMGKKIKADSCYECSKKIEEYMRGLKNEQ